MKEKCGLKGCYNFLGPGSSEIGFENDGKISKVKACSHHTWILMTAPRGSFIITPVRELKPIRATPKIII